MTSRKNGRSAMWNGRRMQIVPETRVVTNTPAPETGFITGMLPHWSESVITRLNVTYTTYDWQINSNSIIVKCAITQQ